MTTTTWLDAHPWGDQNTPAPDALDKGADTIASVYWAANLVITGRPALPYPGYGPTPRAPIDVARRAIGALLAEGWTPPA